jgi:hypothetical protein
MQRVSAILNLKLFGSDKREFEMERRERFRRTSAEWAGTDDDLGADPSTSLRYGPNEQNRFPLCPQA